VLLLGAEFSAARARLHDPRGAWGFLTETRPGSRAKLASVLAASTIAKSHDREATPASTQSVPIGNAATGASEAPIFSDSATSHSDAPSETPLHAKTQTNVNATSESAVAQRDGPEPPTQRSPAERIEDSATYAAALTLVQAGRAIAAADRYVRRYPWSSVLIAAAAAVAMTAVAGRRRGEQPGTVPVDGRAGKPTLWQEARGK
jgi:membrane protein